MRGRTIRDTVATLLLITGLVLLPLGLLAHWAHRTLFDTEGFVQAVGPLADDESVRNSFAHAVVAGIVEPEATVGTLNDRFGILPDNWTDSIKDVPQQVAGLAVAVIDKPGFSEYWRSANGSGHAMAIAVLSGRTPDNMAVTQGGLALDLSSLRGEILAEARAQGFEVYSSDLKVLPERVVIVDAEYLYEARQYYDLGRVLLPALFVAPLVLIALGVALSRHRAAALRRTGLGITVAVTALGGLWLVCWGLVDRLLDGTPLMLNERVVFAAMTKNLIWSMLVMLGAGAAMVFLGSRALAADRDAPQQQAGPAPVALRG